MSTEELLLEFQSDDPTANERCGFVLEGDRIIELENVADDPNADFATRPEDVLEHIDEAIATWHTHPGGKSGLSVADYLTFLSFPGFTHYIVGTDGVSVYLEDGGAIINA